MSLIFKNNKESLYVQASETTQSLYSLSLFVIASNKNIELWSL